MHDSWDGSETGALKKGALLAGSSGWCGPIGYQRALGG